MAVSNSLLLGSVESNGTNAFWVALVLLLRDEYHEGSEPVYFALLKFMQ